MNLPHSGHVKVGVCAGISYFAMSMIMPRLFPQMGATQVYTRNADMPLTASMVVAANAALGAYVATETMGLQISELNLV